MGFSNAPSYSYSVQIFFSLRKIHFYMQHVFRKKLNCTCFQASSEILLGDSSQALTLGVVRTRVAFTSYRLFCEKLALNLGA